jgi:protein SCO1/2
MARLKWVAVLAVFLGLGLAALAVWGPRRNEALPVYATLPPFKLVGADKQPFDSAQLAGKVWVASFVYTSCKNSCPMLGMQMTRISKLLVADQRLALVSITVDPKKDTPEVLKSYATGLGVDDPRWHFLTGKTADIKALVEKGFLLTAEPGVEVLDERGKPDILHSSKLVLIDAQGRIRGYYDGLLGSSVPALKSDIQRLLKA